MTSIVAYIPRSMTPNILQYSSRTGTELEICPHKPSNHVGRIKLVKYGVVFFPATRVWRVSLISSNHLKRNGAAVQI